MSGDFNLEKSYAMRMLYKLPLELGYSYKCCANVTCKQAPKQVPNIQLA